MAFRFYPAQHIRRRSDFESFRASSCRKHCSGFLLVGIENSKRDALPRIGIISPKRVGNAPERNYLRRVMREIFRQTALPRGRDWLVVFYPSARQESFDSLKKSFAKGVEDLQNLANVNPNSK